MALLDQVPAEDKALMVSAAAEGEYQVLLGAGASHDSFDSTGDKIPLAHAMADILRKDFSLNAPADLALSYERAVRRFGEGHVYSRLRQRFTSCTPARWYEYFVSLPWRRIWTLNIDDVVERAYLLHRGTALQDPRAHRWDDVFEENGALQIVHLHGYLGSPRPRRLVFSIAEYLDAREKMHAWHRVFGDYWQTQPFIVIGSKLLSEYDLATVFRAKRAATQVPTLYIGRSIDVDTQQDLRDWGLTPIQGTAEEFITELKREVDALGPSLSHIWLRAGIRRGALAEFSSSFRPLSPSLVIRPADHHDFLSGDPPIWEDVVDDLDAVLTWEQELSSALDQDFLGGRTQKVHVVLEKRLVGSSTGAFRIAKMQQSPVRQVFLFRAEHRPDVSSTVAYLAEARNTILLFDGVADFADDVQMIARKCTERDVQCVILAFEYSSRRDKVLAELNGPQVVLYDKLDLRRLSRKDAETLVRHVDTLKRNARIRDLSFSQKAKLFQNRGLFAGMAELEYGRVSGVA